MLNISIQTVLILLLVVFIFGLMAGVSLSRPRS
jgi:hypothetical protein